MIPRPHGLMLVELGLGGRKSSGEIVVIKCRVDDLMAVLGEVGRFDATGDRVSAVEEEDFHGFKSPPGTAPVQVDTIPSMTRAGCRAEAVVQNRRL